MDAARSILVRLCCCSWALAAAACAPKPDPVMSVDDLMEDRVALDGLLMKCNQAQGAPGNDASCANARIASERLARRTEAAQQEKRAAEFERNREKLREAEDQRRRAEEAKKPDAYHLPVVPVEPPPASGDDTKPR
jgi:hypothetical protein